MFAASAHCVVPGLHIPPQALVAARQALEQVIGEPHCPIWLQVSTTVELVQRVVPGEQAAHAPPTQATGQVIESTQEPLFPHVCTILPEHWVVVGLQLPPQAVPTQTKGHVN